MLDSVSSKVPLERILISASLALGLLHAWVGRYAMNPDGMSYLDVGDSFFRHDWANAVNAWWSPLYPWTLGLVLGLAKPSPRWEFPLVHLVNFGIFVAALFAFRFLLHTLLGHGREQTSDAMPDDEQALPKWTLLLLAYPIFWWIALEAETLYEVSPDLAVMACVCLITGMLLHLRQDDALWKFALFGLILGLGYWTKTILFPLGFVTLGVGYLWKRSRPGWWRGMAVAGLVFLCASAPLIYLLSQQKGRFTFGDSGEANYAWYVAPRTFWRNWQGEVPGSGTPAHPTRQLLRHPPIFEFDGPVVGTYPPWTDPSYWNEGLQWHFKLKPQAEVLAGTTPSEVRLLLRARPELVAGLIALALLSGQLWLSAVRELWPFIATPIVGMGIYLPLIENDRYLGGPVMVLFLTLIAALRLSRSVQKSVACVAVAVFLVMALGTADYTVRVAMNHMAIPGTGPESAWRDVVAAEHLRRMGAQPGDKVAVIADGTGAYWARLGKLRIVAEIMDANHGSREFWDAPEEVRQQVYAIFARARAKLVVTSCPPCPPRTPTGWEQIAGTPYCVRPLQRLTRGYNELSPPLLRNEPIAHRITVDLPEKIRTLPTSPGVYLYKNAEGEVIYVGKAKNLRSRVSSYFHEGRWEDAKTGTLVREAVDVDYIVVANNKEALALENHLIKQKKPRFNILLRDDKTYPYVKLTLAERFPRVYVTRRLRKDGSAYYGPYFPANLAYRIVDLIHRHFLVPSCKVDLTRYHPRPCLQYYIKRCLGPCVKELTTPEIYSEAVRDVKLFLEGRQTDLVKSLRERMAEAAQAEEFERAARYRDLISTVEQLQEKQRIAAAEGDDADVFGYHYENQMLAVNLFHMRGGRVLDRREFFWEDLPEFASPQDNGKTGAPARPGDDHVETAALGRPGEQSSPATSFHPADFFSALVKQLYLAQPYVPRNIYIPVDFEDREELEEALSEQLASEGGRATRVHITVPQRGDKRELIDLAGNNAKQSYDQRFRVMKPNARAIQEAFQDALALPELPKRIECFDISHIQGAETVASMVVWEEGKMNKSDYRKFIIKTVAGVDDFASMREVVTRRYRRLQEENRSMPSLVLIDGGLGQLHAAAQALEALEIINQPLASIAKREEIIYIYGQEDDPVVLDHHSPVLHLVQMIRDEAHRFAVTFHRKRRQIRDRATELREIPGVGESTTRRLLEHFGSLQAVKQADVAALSAVVTKSQAEAILEHFRKAVARTE